MATRMTINGVSTCTEAGTEKYERFQSGIGRRKRTLVQYDYRHTDGELWLSGNFWLLSFKISYLCLPLFYETRTTPSCHPSGCAYRQL